MGTLSTSRMVRLGARGSALAQVQARWVADALQRQHPGLVVQWKIYKTTGDLINDRPLHDIGGKGLFIRELERALIDDEIDLAVHSFKDVPVTMPLVAQDELVIASVPAREDERDVLVGQGVMSLETLASGAKVGTSSLRRRCQVLAARPDLRVESIRGNIDTRLRKLEAGEFDAIILALAGLRRANLFDPSWMTILSLDEMLPAAGQGALAIQCRRGDESTRSLVEALDDAVSHRCVLAERRVVARLNGDCHSPIAVLASAALAGGEVTLRGLVGGRDGTPPVVRASVRGKFAGLLELADALYEQLADQGAHRLLGTAPGACG